MPSSLSLEAYLNARLLGQSEAVAEFSSVIACSEAGPARPGRLRGFVLLLGPTGTGKTEMVKLAARYLYGAGGETRLRRFDMGEFQHRDSVQRLYGAGGERPLLGEAIDALNAQGGGILLLDEIEKAYPDLLMALLSFDDARATMADGCTKDLSACYVVMTSNIGAAEASMMVTSGYSAIRRKVLHEAEQVFRKETVARFTATIVLRCLDFDTQCEIARGLLAKEIGMQSRHRRQWLEPAGEAVVLLVVAKGYTPDLGARNLRKTVERLVGEALLAVQAPCCEEPQDRGLEIGCLWETGLCLCVEEQMLVARPVLWGDGGWRGSLRHQALDTRPQDFQLTS